MNSEKLLRSAFFARKMSGFGIGIDDEERHGFPMVSLATEVLS